jgi:hypothetical protein
MNEKATDIIEDLSMVTPKDEWWWVWPAVWVLAFLLVAGFFLWRSYRRKQLPFQQHPPVPAHVTAKERLAAIHHLIAEGRFREFVIEVSRVLRCYIEDRFALRAPHLSTEEFLYEAEQSDSLTLAYQELLEDFLSQCDLVKFALGGMDLAQVEQLYRTTEHFIDETAIRPAEAPGARAPK